jgi:ATP-dependent Lon protease
MGTDEPIAVLPVRRVIFPGQLASFAIGKKASVALIDFLLTEKLGRSLGRLDEASRAESATLLAVSLADPEESGPAPLPVRRVATAVQLLEVRAVKDSGGSGSIGASGAEGGGGGGGGGQIDGGKGERPVYLIVVQGTERLLLEDEPVEREPFLRVRAQRLPTHPGLDADSATAWGLTLQGLAYELLRGLQGATMATSTEAASSIATAVRDAAALLSASGGVRRLDFRALGRLADGLAAAADASTEEKQAVLESESLGRRAELVVGLLKRQLEVLRLSHKIHEQVKGELSRTQREYFLRQQLRAIRNELNESGADGGGGGGGSGGGGGLGGGGGGLGSDAEPRDETHEVAARLQEAALPENIRTAAERELRRLRQMQPMQAEYSVLLHYLDWVAAMPWGRMSQDSLDLSAAHDILNLEHHGLEKVKRRVYEHLAVLSLRRDTRGPILCLVGPPGVGKTSLGRAVASALGRPFERISLGGVSDAAEVRGHRRTYVGSMPGLLVQAVRRAGVCNPVIMLDEIDKIGRDGRSDPTAALLEVLDPAQNAAFTDHFLNLPLDLSKVLFMATANSVDAIPPALIDRMEVLEMSGYTHEEKLQIAQEHLLPRQLANAGLPERFVKLPEPTLSALTEGYTREAGLRNLEREIGAICRALAVRYASLPESERDKAQPTSLSPDDLEPILGPRRFERETREPLGRPGVALGLAWTPIGGTLLFIETSAMGGSGELILTGQLGEVMQESVRTALSWIRSHAPELGLRSRLGGPSPAPEPQPPPQPPPQPTTMTTTMTPLSPLSPLSPLAPLAPLVSASSSLPSLLSGVDVHVHFPAGAIRKDGPSAGTTTLVALVSLLTGRFARSDTAMSGEISLRGAILPVGGIREKVLAAHRAGIFRVCLPRANQKDTHELTAKVRAEMSFVWCETIEDLLSAALVDGHELVAPMRRLAGPTAATAGTGGTGGTGGGDVPNVPPPAAPHAPAPPSILAARSRL